MSVAIMIFIGTISSSVRQSPVDDISFQELVSEFPSNMTPGPQGPHVIALSSTPRILRLNFQQIPHQPKGSFNGPISKNDNMYSMNQYI